MTDQFTTGTVVPDCFDVAKGVCHECDEVLRVERFPWTSTVHDETGYHEASCQVCRECAEAFVTVTVLRSKAEILRDIESGRVPSTVTSFTDLHDYVDANEYGGLTDSFPWIGPGGGIVEEWFDQTEEVQSAVDSWLKAGRPEGVTIDLPDPDPSEGYEVTITDLDGSPLTITVHDPDGLLRP